MTTSGLRRGAVVGLVAASGILAACGGGGGGGGSAAGSSSSSFLLADVKYGRSVDDGSGPRLVSPLTTATIDPTTGLLIPGTLQPLSTGVDLAALQSVGLGPGYLPRVIPRNCVIQLEFTAPVDPNTLKADSLDSQGVLIPGSIQVRLQSNSSQYVPVKLTLVNARTIWVSAITAGNIGFPASPVDFGPSGEPRADATGFLKLRIPRNGSTTLLRSTKGAFLGARADLLGDPTTPIGLNPGNRVLDFVTQNQLIPTNETFNGFLPDEHAPRIIRTYETSHTLSFGSGDSANANSVTDFSANYTSSGHGGLGEWAGAVLTLRPGTPFQETHAVASNSSTKITIVGSFTRTPQDGDTFKLDRTEYFEPDLNDPVDPTLFDPDDPQNPNNSSLVNFVDVLEIDATTGNPLPGAVPTSLHQTAPAYSELQVHFSEPMAADSFLQWESFRVAFNPDPNADTGSSQELLTDVVLDPNQTTATIRPVRVDQVAGTTSVVGWGKGTKNLQLIVRAVPKTDYLQQFMSSDQVAAFLDQGYRGLLDLGGQPLGFPNSRFDPNNPVVKYNVLFSSSESASTVQPPPPAVSSWGVIVHRMRGRPTSGVDPATGLAGVGFKDQPNYYRPIADVNLQVNGVLAGSPVVYVTKVTDDFFPPPHGQYGKFPLGVPEPLSTPQTLTTGSGPHNGARFQTVWRDLESSPNRDSLKGTLLDLYRVSWAPIGGNVTTDNYDNVSIHCAHSPFRPKTTQSSAGASYPDDGLGQPFDYNSWITMVDPNQSDACTDSCFYSQGPNYWDTLVTVVSPGTKYKVTQSNLFAPPFDGNAYHPWPSFTTKFQYNNGDIPQAETDLRSTVNTNYKCSGGTAWLDDRKFNSNADEDNFGGDSLLLEVRIRPQNTAISRQNGFTMAIGILNDFQPFFRVWSKGSDVAGKINPDDVTNDSFARCAQGDNSNPGSSHGYIGSRYGDNSRYFSVFDYVKTTSTITSPFVRVWPSNTVSPNYFTPIFVPPLSAQPAGTQVNLQWAGANDTKGTGAVFASSIDSADGFANLAFQVTFVGNTKTLLLPNFETVAIPFLRPQGQ